MINTYIINRGLGYILLIFTLLLLSIYPQSVLIMSILWGTLIAIVISYTGFFLRWLALDAVSASILIGLLAYSIGGWWILLMIFLCFFLDRLINYILMARSPENQPISPHSCLWIWSHGFWFGLWLVIWKLSGESMIFWWASLCVLTSILCYVGAEKISIKYSHLRDKTLCYQKHADGFIKGINWIGLLSAALWSAFGGIVAFLIAPEEDNRPLLASMMITILSFLGWLLYSALKLMLKLFPQIIPYQAKEKSYHKWLCFISHGITSCIAILIVNI